MNNIQLSQVPKKKNWGGGGGGGGGVTYRTTYILIFLDRTFLNDTLSFQSLFIWPIIILLEPRWEVNKIIVVFESLFNFKITYRTTYIPIFLDRTFLNDTLSFQSLFIWPIIILLEPRWEVNKIIVVFESLFNFKIILISKSCQQWTSQSN